MTERMYKCFVCGKMYGDEQSAVRCHNAPVQKVKKVEGRSKPKFLGN